MSDKLNKTKNEIHTQELKTPEVKPVKEEVMVKLTKKSKKEYTEVIVSKEFPKEVLGATHKTSVLVEIGEYKIWFSGKFIQRKLKTVIIGILPSYSYTIAGEINEEGNNVVEKVSGTDLISYIEELN